MDEQLLTLHEALALDRLEDFVRQAEARGVELTSGSDLERALALLITRQRGRQDQDCKRSPGCAVG